MRAGVVGAYSPISPARIILSGPTGAVARVPIPFFARKQISATVVPGIFGAWTCRADGPRLEIIGTRTLLWLLCLGRLARHCSRFASGFTDHLRGPSLFTALASRSGRPTGQRRHDRNVTAWASWPHWNPVELRRTSTCGEIPGGELNAKSFRRPTNEGDATNFGCNPATVVHVQMTRIPRAMSLISLPRARQLGAPGVPGTTAA